MVLLAQQSDEIARKGRNCTNQNGWNMYIFVLLCIFKSSHDLVLLFEKYIWKIYFSLSSHSSWTKIPLIHRVSPTSPEFSQYHTFLSSPLTELCVCQGLSSYASYLDKMEWSRTWGHVLRETRRKKQILPNWTSKGRSYFEAKLKVLLSGGTWCQWEIPVLASETHSSEQSQPTVTLHAPQHTPGLPYALGLRRLGQAVYTALNLAFKGRWGWSALLVRNSL